MMNTELKKRIEDMIESEYDKWIHPLYSDTSPIGLILRVALENHTTPQCKLRCVIEGFYSWYLISKDDFYLELSEGLIQYANLVYNNRIEMNFFRELILEKWMDYSASEFPYLVVDIHDRMKSLTSEINDLVDKTLKSFISRDLIQRAFDLFCDEERQEAAQILIDLGNKFSNSRNTDIYGAMFVVDYCDRIRDCDNPEFLRKATLKLAKNCMSFMEQNNINILSQKNFITNPKVNEYSSFHVVIQGIKSPLEIQFRSLSMHYHDEDPESPASHLSYKDRPFNNFLKAIVDDVYGICPQNPRTFKEAIEAEEIQKQRIGITDGIPLFSVARMHRTPNGEIPRALEELEKFEAIEKLAELYARISKG